jgi:putative aminopeptidase FrvX
MKPIQSQWKTILAATLAICLSLHHSLAQQASVPIETIKQRLSFYKGNDTKREAALKQLFVEAGCNPANLSEQTVPSRKQPNLICLLPGATPATIIIIGAHFDHAEEGDGVVDNWSGASLLPSLFQVLAASPRQHTFLFIGFTGEESGLVGSDFYVKQSSPEQLANIQAMINLDSLGLGPTKVWVSQSDPRLVNTIAAVAHIINVPIAGMDVNGLGESDEESFIAQKVCTLTIHSLTPANAHILHRPDDNPTAIHLPDLYDSFRLLARYLTSLDTLAYPSQHVCTIKPVDNTAFRSRSRLRH